MLSIAERVMLLRSVGIFASTPDQALADVALLLEQLDLPSGATVFEKGAPGDCMYIIAAGRVRVRDGDRVLNDLWACDVFGEIALLDAETRSATVQTVEQTRLLRLDQGPFYDLLATHAEVGRGIIRVLCQHLRARMRDLAKDYAYMQRMARLTAAASALEAGVYQPEGLDEAAQSPDAVGQLAQVFKRMAAALLAREQQLRAQVQALTIEIDATRQARQVAAITETDYFRELQGKARQLRAVRGPKAQERAPEQGEQEPHEA